MKGKIKSIPTFGKTTTTKVYVVKKISHKTNTSKDIIYSTKQELPQHESSTTTTTTTVQESGYVFSSIAYYLVLMICAIIVIGLIVYFLITLILNYGVLHQNLAMVKMGYVKKEDISNLDSQSEIINEDQTLIEDVQIYEGNDDSGDDDADNLKKKHQTMVKVIDSNMIVHYYYNLSHNLSNIEGIFTDKIHDSIVYAVDKQNNINYYYAFIYTGFNLNPSNDKEFLLCNPIWKSMDVSCCCFVNTIEETLCSDEERLILVNQAIFRVACNTEFHDKNKKTRDLPWIHLGLTADIINFSNQSDTECIMKLNFDCE